MTTNLLPQPPPCEASEPPGPRLPLEVILAPGEGPRQRRCRCPGAGIHRSGSSGVQGLRGSPGIQGFRGATSGEAPFPAAEAPSPGRAFAAGLGWAGLCGWRRVSSSGCLGWHQGQGVRSQRSPCQRLPQRFLLRTVPVPGSGGWFCSKRTNRHPSTPHPPR